LFVCIATNNFKLFYENNNNNNKMKRVNYEKYRFESKSPLRQENASFTRTSLAAISNEPQANAHNANKRVNVTKTHEKIKLTQKYRILSAHDPNTGINYDLNQMIKLRLINKFTSSFCLPSTGEHYALDDAIQLGYVLAELIDECIESSNETYELVHSLDANNNNNNLSIDNNYNNDSINENNTLTNVLAIKVVVINIIRIRFPF
jgi:hypothetical protein